MEKKLTKRQQKAMDPNAMVDNIPTIPTSFDEIKKRIVEGLTMKDELTPEGAAKPRRAMPVGKPIDAMDRDAQLMVNPEGFSTRQIQELQSVDEDMEKKARMEALQNMARQSPPPEPMVNPAMDTMEEKAYAEALKKDARLAEPENKRRFMNLINKK